ncbi:MAG: preprotein translocase subunit SecG [Bryobacteraceae bacterium]
MYILILLIHIVVCIFLIIVVLLQSGKAADLAGAFGGMGSQTTFGPRGSASLLSRATTISAVLFMITSLSLSILATRNAGLGATVLEGTPAGSAPVKGAPAPVQIPAPGRPINVTPSGGKTMQIPLPPANRQNAPAPAQPAPAKK